MREAEGMMPNSKKVVGKTGWRYKMHERTANEVLGRYKHNRPFIINLILMFDYLARSCMLLWNRENAVHIFFNYNSAYEEIDYRVIPQKVPNEKSAETAPYQRYQLQSYQEVKDLAKLVRGADDRFSERGSPIPRVRMIIGDGKKILSDNEHICRMGISKDLTNESDPVVLIMDDAHGNLGCFILYGSRSPDQQSEPFADDASSNNTVVDWSRTISGFLAQQASTTSETYLPSYRQTHSTKTAVLFADITNFTQLATMLRIIQASQGHGKVETLGKILQGHCREMSCIVAECKGRVERFIGDGLMAVFGEHEEDAIIAVGSAVAAATAMVKGFRKRRETIEDEILGDSGQNEINEMIELDLSVGINYGTVLFDYLGDEKHREYSCIGDHVAFAERLMHKAARFDPDTGQKWPPILISQTAARHFKYWLGSKQVWSEKGETAKRILHAKGYGYPSYVYGFETDFFELDRYNNVMNQIWNREKCERDVVDALKVNF